MPASPYDPDNVIDDILIKQCQIFDTGQDMIKYNNHIYVAGMVQNTGQTE